MSAPQNLAEAIRAERMVDAAWDAWIKRQPADDAPADEADEWMAGDDAFCVALTTARAAISAMPVASLPDIHAKLAWLLSEDRHSTDMDALASVLAAIGKLLDRPTQDAFAVKLRAYDRAVRDCDEARAAGAGDTVMGPLYSAAHDCGKAVMLEPAPDVAALTEKRRIFDALQYDEDAENPTVAHRLFADAIALAGGAA